MRNLLLVIIFFFLYAQNMYAQNSEILISGKVVENDNKLPIEYATIALITTSSKA